MTPKVTHEVRAFRGLRRRLTGVDMAEHWDDLEPLEDAEPNISLNVGTLSSIIDDYITKHPDTECRQYIGASSIGSPCERKLWYGYTGVAGTNTEPQLQRTFDIGKSLEKLVLDYLEAAGCTLQRKPSLLFFRHRDIPQLQGHADAIWYINGEPPRQAIIEVKTARHSSFNVFVEKGLAEWYPVYYAQVQAYMGMSGIHEAYVIAINKDTSALHDECVRFDAQNYEMLCNKALRIVAAEEAPARINQNSSFFICRNCQYNKVCHV